MKNLCVASVNDLSSELLDELYGTDTLFSRLQQKDGGFVGRLGEKTSDLYYTFFSMETFKMLEKENLLDCDGLRNFLISCYDNKGGFGYRKGSNPDIVHTFCGIGASIANDNFFELDHEKIGEFILSLKSNEGGFLKDENSTRPTAYSTFYGVLSMFLLDKEDLLDKDFVHKTSEFLSNLKTPEGGFRASLNSGHPNLVETASAIFTLYLLDNLNYVNKEQIINFILECKVNGSFKNHLKSSFPDLNSIFCAVNSLTLLEALDKISSENVIDSIIKFRTPWGGFTNMGPPDIEYTYYAIYSIILLSRER